VKKYEIDSESYDYYLLILDERGAVNTKLISTLVFNDDLFVRDDDFIKLRNSIGYYLNMN